MTTDTVQTLTARIVGVFEGNSGWHDIKTDGTPAKLSTKKAGNIFAARAAQARGDVVAIDYTQRQNGQYTNYYLEAVRQPAQDEVGNTEPDGPVSFAPIISGYTGIGTPPQTDDREVKIMRQSATKAAVGFLAAKARNDANYVPKTEDVTLLADFFVEYFQRGR